MREPLFNPFEDRASRDLRNELSEAFASTISSRDNQQLTSIVNDYRNLPMANCYHEYLEDRWRRYKQALNDIGRRVTDPIEQAIILWNQGLFFEVHEVLEHAWYVEKNENLKLTMQALIRAAGVYIKRKYGFMDSAARIAAKAIPVLEANKAILAPYFVPDKLTSVLGDSDLPPPLL